MWMPLEIFEANIGFTLGTIITIIYLFGGLIFYAIDFKIGIILHFFIGGGLFLMFYQLGWNYSTILTLTLIFLVFMSLSILFVGQQSDAGGVI